MSRSPESIRVVIVDDHPVVRVGLKTMLESDGRIVVVGMASSAREAVSVIQSSPPDVVIMDLACRKLRERRRYNYFATSNRVFACWSSPTTNLMKTSSGALRAGAMGYLLKSAPQDEITQAVELISHNQRCIPPHIAQRLSEAVTYESLSKREHEVLCLVARGLTNKEIAQELFITDKTARNHVTSCLLKLGASDRTEAVTKAISRGLLRLEAK